MGKGWIHLHRSLIDHWLWQEKPFSRGQAWIDLLFQANHSDNKFLLGNELITLERGEFVTSELKLMERWGWGKTKVRAFLNLLQIDNMIVKKTNHKRTAIKIVNYSKYNDYETTEKPETNHSQTIDKPFADTNKNEKNEKNEKKEREGELPPVTVKRFPAGKYQNVFLSQEEAVKLQKEFPNEAAAMIETLSEYMETSGKSYKNHFAVIAKWIREDRKNPKKKQKEDAIDAKQRANYGEHWTDHIFDT